MVIYANQEPGAKAHRQLILLSPLAEANGNDSE